MSSETDPTQAAVSPVVLSETLRDEPLSEEEEMGTSDESFLSGSSDDEWVVDASLTRQRTEAEKNALPTTGRTLGLQRFEDAIASIERRALALEKKKAEKKALNCGKRAALKTGDVSLSPEVTPVLAAVAPTTRRTNKKAASKKVVEGSAS